MTNLIYTNLKNISQKCNNSNRKAVRKNRIPGKVKYKKKYYPHSPNLYDSLSILRFPKSLHYSTCLGGCNRLYCVVSLNTVFVIIVTHFIERILKLIVRGNDENSHFV